MRSVELGVWALVVSLVHPVAFARGHLHIIVELALGLLLLLGELAERIGDVAESGRVAVLLLVPVWPSVNVGNPSSLEDRDRGVVQIVVVAPRSALLVARVLPTVVDAVRVVGIVVLTAAHYFGSLLSSGVCSC